jgi:AcrR family transcriptional regulator
MSYRKLENIDEAIVKATIALGGTRKAARGFAVKDIAEKCAISEYLIFRHFTTKQNLMATADKRVGYLLASEARTLRKTSTDFDQFFFRYLDWLLAHKEIIFFSLSYGHGVPHSSDIPVANLEEFNQILEADAQVISLLPQDVPTGEQSLAWKFFLRNLLYFAGFFLTKDLEDNAENRAWIRQTLFHGVASFVPKEAHHEPTR